MTSVIATPARINRSRRGSRTRGGFSAWPILAAVLLGASTTPVSGAAASQDAALRGTVRNEGGAGLPNVRITILHLDSSDERGTVTDARGNYRTGGLEPGGYRLSVTVEGFAPFSQQIELAADEDRTVAIVLVAAGPDYKAVFESTPDRWRLPLPEWQRYPPNQPGTYPFVVGSPWDPYNQNTIKGDRPVIGQDVFFVLTGTSFTPTEFRQLPTPTGVSTARPDSDPFFGEPDQFELQPNLIVSLELFKGDTAFRPKDWSIKITPVFNLNYVSTQENNAVDINPEEGRSRFRQDLALQEAFGEVKLFDVGSNYDATSARAGIQPFISDFRGFLYRDNNLGFRLFGSWGRNRHQWNLAYFNQLEKETNSGLNTFENRDQQVIIANYYRQDTFTLGYTVSLLAGANLDDGDELSFDANGFLVRPAPIGTVRSHKVRAYYVGFGGDGHWGRINVSHQFYQAFGTDELNGIAGGEVEINAQFAVLELSIDKDWYRPKITAIYASGDGNPGLPNPLIEPGRPKSTLSNRGFGTLNRTDPVVIGAQKTRLMDPTLNTIGTNDRAGDYRSSGCTACHVVYANDRSPVHSGSYAAYGNAGESHSSDSTIPRNEAGHPVQHRLTSAIPTSQCMVCHMHPGTNMMATYVGFMWWDNETDGDKMYPASTGKISAAERAAIEIANPEGSAVRGLWSDRDFLQQTGTEEFNRGLDQTVFADFHGHGWMYRAVFKRDRKGNLLSEQGNVVQGATPQMLWDAVMHRDTGFERQPLADNAPVHLKDIHLERGMHCVDCHLQQDAHGNGNLYGEPRNMIEITCEDCHGTINERTRLVTSGPGAPPGGTDLQATGRFSRDGESILLTSALDPSVEWEIPQIVDSLDPGSPRFNEGAAYAKTLQKDGETWGGAAPPDVLAHASTNMTCASCHTSWMTSCFGCHLAQRADEKRPNLHNEAADSRNWTQYNYQVLRDDVFMLARDGSVIGGRISPARSSSAVVVSSQDRDRNWIYFQEQTVSAEGYSGQAFNTHVPHTVRRNETRACDDCHVSSEGDNNAIMAQLLTLGTNLTNFMGRFVYIGTGHGGLQAIAVTEMDEPQAVIGSDLHRLAYPEQYAKHLQRARQLTTSEHHGSTDALSVQKRGEYVFIADGEGGLKVLDIAQVNNKAFSEKIISAPVSPIGQQTNVKTRHATAVALPSTLAIDPARRQLPANEEQPIHPLFSYAYVSDLEEGLVVTTANTLLDGNPTNNFLERVLAFNPDGRLDGAVSLTVAGTHLYVLTDDAMVVIDIDDPLQPRIVAEINDPLRRPRAVAIQFRYAFVTDADGFKVIDVTDPGAPKFISDATVQLQDARGLYVARTYAYVAGGNQGLVILDIERPERPRIDQVFDAGGAIDDAHDVKVAMTNASVFAYVADGHNGLRVVQLVSSNDTPGAFGFSPRPQPELIASYHTHGPALSISKGLDRDRAVDESGNQLVVFGRRGGRPFTLEEMQRLYLRDGRLWTVPSRQR